MITNYLECKSLNVRFLIGGLCLFWYIVITINNSLEG